MTYEVEKNSKEWADRLPADLKTRLESAVERARKALRGDDMNEIRSAQEELSKAFSEAGQSFYAQAQAGATETAGAPAGGQTAGTEAGAGAGATASRPDDTVEADYEIVDEGKK
jgi:molecular chaperone DnaK